MKKVLMIGEIWPYHKSAGNCIHAIAKYLPEMGWEPIILTTPISENYNLNYKVVEVPYKDFLLDIIKRIGFDTSKSVKKQISQKMNITKKRSFLDYFFLRIREVLFYPDSNHSWKIPAIRKGSEIIENEKIEAIISDVPPIMGQLISHTFKKKYNIPWIVYFSHLWSQNNGYPYSKFRRMFDERLELQTFSSIDVMITHSKPLMKKLEHLHPGKRILTEYEGFDPEIINEPPSKLTNRFTITYTGSFATDLREPAHLFISLKKLITRGVVDPNKLEVRFYGPEETWIEQDIKKCGLSEVVKQYGRVSMEEAQAAQRESQILFNPKWDDPEEPGIFSGKIFEYLAARRPILATGRYIDVVDEMLKETQAGKSSLSIESTIELLKQWYSEYMNLGYVKYEGNKQIIDKLNHRELARTFAHQLDKLTSNIEKKDIE